MDSQDYIKEGIELADGWQGKTLYDDGETMTSLVIEDRYYGIPSDLKLLPKLFKAALAAQITEQVDALGDDVCMEISSTGGMRISRVMDMKELAIEIGPDRQMNSIKAIVDSKVLVK